MVKFDVIEGDQIGDVRMNIQAIFGYKTTPYSTVSAIQVISEIFKNIIATRLNVGIEEMDISIKTIRLKLIFKPFEEGPNELSIENLGRIRANFVFYLFACIDQAVPLDKVPFPENFRYFLNLPDTLANEYGWT